MHSLLNLPTIDKSTDAPFKIFSSRDRSKKKLAFLPMLLPAVEEINARWKALENKTEGNPPSEGAEKLNLSREFVADLPLLHPLCPFLQSSVWTWSLFRKNTFRC